MHTKLKEHIEKQLPFLEGKKLLIACSGGVDSVVLGYFMRELSFKMGLAHANFSLRGEESDGDEAFVMDLAKKWKVPVYSKTFPTLEYAEQNKCSTQMAARELRYSWFASLQKEYGYDYVLTAHHADDSLETLLINLSRGTGLQGLMGIPTINDTLVRPLLIFTRTEILEFAKKNQLFWREDSSNAKTDYLRNKLRHEVIPPFKAIGEQVLKRVQKTQAHLRDSHALVQDYADLVRRLVMNETPQGIEISLQKLQELPHPEALLYELLSPYGFTAWEDISHLISAQSGKQVFSQHYRLLKDREVFLLTEIPSETEKKSTYIQKNERQIAEPLRMTFIPTDTMGYIDKNTIYVDTEKLAYPLELRKWEEGDFFHPLGMKGKKKLSKFFKDEKLSLASKEQIWVLLSQEKVIWVVGWRADDRFKVTPKTKNVLKISVAH
ncbi:MAG: tRNA lysidine(34) synthetase TilS [Flavobacteriaceae bacterium]